MLIDKSATVKSINRKRFRQGMRVVIGDRISEDIARPRRCLEAPCSPTAVKIQAFYGRFTDYRAGIWTGVDDAPPLSVHAHATERGEKFAYGLQGMFNHVE